MEQVTEGWGTVPMPRYLSELLEYRFDREWNAYMAHSILDSSFLPPTLGRSHSDSNSSLISAGVGSLPTPRSERTLCKISGDNGGDIKWCKVRQRLILRDEEPA